MVRTQQQTNARAEASFTETAAALATLTANSITTQRDVAEIRADIKDLKGQYATKEELRAVQQQQERNNKILNWVIAAIGTPAIAAIVYAFSKLVLK